MAAESFSPTTITAAMNRNRFDNSEAKAALYGYDYQPSVPTPNRKQGVQINPRGVSQAPFATSDDTRVHDRAGAAANMARVRDAPFAVGVPEPTPAPAPGRHANMGRNAPKEAPFAMYDQATTGNAYREYEARHEAAPHPASAYGNAIPAPRPAPREKPFAVDDGPSVGFPPSYTPQAAKKGGAYGKITGDGADRGFDPAVYAAARVEMEKHGRPHIIAEAPFAVGNNYAGGAPGGAPAYSKLQKKEGNMGKITGGDAGFDPQVYANVHAENARINDAVRQRKYVGSGNFLSMD